MLVVLLDGHHIKVGLQTQYSLVIMLVQTFTGERIWKVDYGITVFSGYPKVM
jgi:hypothetical protein